jgi:catechol 2,3-dioxygenase-like lactoylglutathione lyase family enzyme
MSSVDLERPVIHVTAVAAVSGGRSCGGGAVAVPASDVRKSAEFYRRVFGFRIPSTWRGASFGSSYSATVLVAGDGRTELWLQARGDRPAQTRRWAFAVTNLEQVRAAVWELGVKVARDSGDPDHIFRRRRGASLYVLDPDGNEIELVETSTIVSRTRPQRGLAAFFGPWCGQNSKPAPITQVESFCFTPGGGSRS